MPRDSIDYRSGRILPEKISRIFLIGIFCFSSTLFFSYSIVSEGLILTYDVKLMLRMVMVIYGFFGSSFYIMRMSFMIEKPKD